MMGLVIGSFFLWKSLSIANGVPSYEPVGCYLDSGISPRPLPRLLKDYRPEMNWNNIEAVIELCAGLANKERFSYFGLQYYGQCWSGVTADQTYGRDGPADSCIRGVGLSSTYFVYKFYDYGGKVPGCETWTAQKDSCYHVITNDSLTDAEANNYCQENGGMLALVSDKDGLRLVEQFLYSMQMNAPMNSSQCVVVATANASLDGSFQSVEPPPTFVAHAGSSSNFTCAKKGLDQKWYLQSCQFDRCHHLCIKPRDIVPVAGTFVQKATDVTITGHVIARLVVDDVIACGRECLLYLNCLSFNYEYKPEPNREYPSLGRICELNDEVKQDLKEEIRRKEGYKYYERLIT